MMSAPGLPADNPQQSDECSHIGLHSNCLCRRCKTGGTTAQKESESGYHNLHKVCYLEVPFQTPITEYLLQPCEPRCVSETKEDVDVQIEAVLRGISGNKIAEMQTLSGQKIALRSIGLIFSWRRRRSLGKRSRASQNRYISDSESLAF